MPVFSSALLAFVVGYLFTFFLFSQGIDVSFLLE
jgi:hypothetical protein